MKFKKILITGGAGFVGSHLADALVKKGCHVRILDCLDPQVHPQRKRPGYLNPQAELKIGDVRRPLDVRRALEGMDAVYHFAAAVGVGQSMYEVNHYVDANSRGAAVLLEEIIRSRKRPKKMVVASSMSIYGEGAYRCRQCGPVFPSLRQERSMRRQKWEPVCPGCRGALRAIPTDEKKPLNPTSVYAVTKRDHEELFLAIGQAYRIPAVALRFFNIYGTRQALSNPYTGVAAIFCGRLLNNQPPLIFEDGKQTRDFVHVSDIVHANVLALESPRADGGVFNVGTGRATSVIEIADLLAEKLGYRKPAQVVRRFRAGDVRHCFADISKISSRLGYHPRVPLKQGIDDLVDWVRSQTARDRVNQATNELTRRGLIR